MTDEPYEPDSDDAADDELAAERAGQSSTVEEAMDAQTDEEGFAHESAYTPSTALTDDDTKADDDTNADDDTKPVDDAAHQ